MMNQQQQGRHAPTAGKLVVKKTTVGIEKTTIVIEMATTLAAKAETPTEVEAPATETLTTASLTTEHVKAIVPNVVFLRMIIIQNSISVKHNAHLTDKMNYNFAENRQNGKK
jgi:hypothetical protein